MILKKYKEREQMTDEQKALEMDYKIHCIMTGNLSNKELNRRYNKTYLLK